MYNVISSLAFTAKMAFLLFILASNYNNLCPAHTNAFDVFELVFCCYSVKSVECIFVFT